MAAQFKAGTFSHEPGTGPQVVTGVGFRPKALMLWGASRTAVDVFDDRSVWNAGFTDGTTSVAFEGWSEDGISTSEQQRVFQEGSVYVAVNFVLPSTTEIIVADATLTSFESDGFTLNWLVHAGVLPVTIHYIAFGGDLDAKVGKFTVPTSTGNIAETGVGFTPTGILFMTAWSTATNDISDRNNFPNFGFTDGTRQGLTWTASEDAQATSDTWRYQRTDRCFGLGNSVDGTVAIEGSIVSMDADGFTVNASTVFASAVSCYYLALGGIAAYVGTITQPAATGAQSITDPAFPPSVLIIQGYGTTAQTTPQAASRFSFSVVDKFANATASWISDEDAAGTMISARYTTASKYLIAAQAAATAASSTFTGVVNTYEGTQLGFDLNWQTCDGTQRQFLYFAMGESAAEGGRCEGGGIIQTQPDEAEGETFIGRALTPRPWLSIGYDDQDRAYGLDASNRPTLRVHGHLITIGAISRYLSDRFSSYKMADCTIEADNDSRWMDTLELAAPSEHWQNREGRMFLASKETIAAAGTPHTLFRGIWRQNLARGLKRSLTFTDILGSEFSDFNLETTIPKRTITSTDFPEAPKDAINRVVPIAYGALSDQQLETVDVSTALPHDSSIAPVNGTFAYDLAGGTLAPGRWWVVVTAVVGGSESAISNPAGTYNTGDRGIVHFFNLTGAASYRGYLHNGDWGWTPHGGTPEGLLAPTVIRVQTTHTTPGDWQGTQIAEASFTWNDETDGSDATAVTTATVDIGHGKISPVYVGIEEIAGTRWHAFVIAGHAIQHVEDIYVDGIAQSLQTNAAIQAIWRVPGFGAEPPYEDISGRRYAILRGKYGYYGPDRGAGLVAEQLIEGQEGSPYAPLALNLCALEDVGNGTGAVITEAPRQVFHLLNQWVLDDYQSGVWGAPATSDDGVPWLNSGSFQALEEIEVDRIGGAGYQGAMYLNEPLTVRQLLSKLLENFDMRFGQNEHGQVIAMHLDGSLDLDETELITDVQEIVEPSSMDPRLNELENRVVFDYGYRFSDGVFTTEAQVVEDATAITANRGRPAVGERRRFEWVNGEDTAVDVAEQAVAFGKYPPRYVDVTCTLHAVRVKLGSIVRVTDADGLGTTGWVERPIWVLGIQTILNDLDRPPQVKLFGVDVKRFLDES